MCQFTDELKRHPESQNVRPKVSRWICLVLLFLSSATEGVAEDWPQWRGPNRTDVSAEQGLLKSWPSQGPPLSWKFENAGIGYSGPSVVGDRLFMMGARQGVEQLLAVDVETGQELWSLDVGEMFENARGNGPRSTPTVSGNRVYALGAGGHLVCAQIHTGELLWRVTMAELGGSPPKWGYCESVLVDQGKVICTPGGSKGAIAALDAATGKTIWQSLEFTDPAAYSSPIVFEWNDTRQYAQLTREALVGVDSANGRVLWKSEWPGRTAVVTTPVYQNGHILVSSGYGVGCKLVHLGPNHSAEDVYFNQLMKNHHGGVILLDDYVFGYSDNRGWTALDFLTGEVLWSEEERLGKGSLTYADGRFYLLSEQEGTVVLIEAATEAWKERGRFQLSPDSQLRQPRWLIWTHPVVANGRLYLRNQELLFSYDIQAN